MKTVSCKTCKGEIPFSNINIAKDIAACENCEQIFSLSSLVKDEAEGDFDFKKLPDYLTLTDLGVNGIELFYKKWSKQAIFLVPFTLVWAGGSMGGIYGTQIAKGKFDLTMSLFGLPFLIGSIVLVTSCLFMLFGYWKITISERNIKVFSGFFGVGWTRNIALNADSKVEKNETTYTVNNQRQVGVCVTTDNKQTLFGSSLPSDVKIYIERAIKRVVEKIR